MKDISIASLLSFVLHRLYEDLFSWFFWSFVLHRPHEDHFSCVFRSFVLH